jgi:CHAD domain-containing protein
MGSERWDEVERTYAVDAAAVLPDLSGVEGVTEVSQPVELHLEAVYFDTAELDLARRGVTLRRRTGGPDAGWHVKLPRGKDTRTELRHPLGRATRTVPKALLAPVRALVRDRPLTPVARVGTRRLRYALLGVEGVVLAEVCDDQVAGERTREEQTAQQWREWEVELVEGEPPLLDAVEETLLDVGAARSAEASKLVRTLGDVPHAAPAMPSEKVLAHGDAAQAVLAHLRVQVAELHRQDARLRADRPGSVHKMRIAARRLRSALKTYGPLLAPDPLSHLGDELRWLGQALSGARDAQVLREHLEHLVAAEPPELVLGPVVSRIDDELRAFERVGHDEAMQAIDSDRYFRLLDALDELLDSPPFTPEGQTPAREVIPRLLQRDAKRLRRAVDAAGLVEGPDERNVALHEARKKAKRLRYAAESAVPLLGKRAKRLAVSVKKVQQALGAHQDTVMSRRVLRDYGVRAHLSGENGFTFGRLHALEQARAAAAVQEFETAWDGVPRKNLRRWLTR